MRRRTRYTHKRPPLSEPWYAATRCFRPDSVRRPAPLAGARRPAHPSGGRPLGFRQAPLGQGRDQAHQDSQRRPLSPDNQEGQHELRMCSRQDERRYDLRGAVCRSHPRAENGACAGQGRQAGDDREQRSEASEGGRLAARRDRTPLVDRGARPQPRRVSWARPRSKASSFMCTPSTR